jgi:nucleoside-diphosphate kinase
MGPARLAQCPSQDQGANPPLAAGKSGLYKPRRNKSGDFMAAERTFSIIKPDATRRNLTGKINARFEEAGLRIVAQKRIWMSRKQAEIFYGVHKARPFFNDLCTFMTSGPVVVQVLEGEGAIARNREIMGATNPANAASGTIRKDFAESIEANSVHGSDSPENAAGEIAFFFAGCEIVG